MLKIFTIGLCSILLSQLFAQPLVSGQFVTDQLIHATMGRAKSIPEYEGSPYLLDSFVNGRVHIKDNPDFKLPIRYNIFDDVLEVKHRGRDMQILPADIITHIEFSGHTLVVGEYEQDEKRIKSFLFLLDSGKVDLLNRKTIKFEEWRPARAQEAGPKPASFKPSIDFFYLRSNNGKIIRIENIKTLPELFPNNRSKISDYIKKHKTKLKQDKLTELVKYYNTLQAESKT